MACHEPKMDQMKRQAKTTRELHTKGSRKIRPRSAVRGPRLWPSANSFLTGSTKQELGWQGGDQPSAFWKFFFDMSRRRDAAYEWGTAEDEKPDYRVLPTTLPVPPFYCGPSDRLSNTSTQGPMAVCQTSFIPRLENLRQDTSGTMLSTQQPLQTPHFLWVHLVVQCLCAMAMKCSRVRPSGLT